MQNPRSRPARTIVGLVAAAGIVAAATIRAADHRDSTLLTGNPAVDINDVYSFQSPSNPNNVVLAMTVSPFIAPSENGTRLFEPGALYQFKIDTNGDAVEDLVIQAMPTSDDNRQMMHVFGPAKPKKTGSITRLVKVEDEREIEVPVSTGSKVFTKTRRGITVFAGLRDDPFFFDLTQFRLVVGGQAPSFRNPGIDTFKGFNTLAIVVEVPAEMLGSSPNVGIWGTTSRPRY